MLVVMVVVCGWRVGGDGGSVCVWRVGGDGGNVWVACWW